MKAGRRRRKIEDEEEEEDEEEVEQEAQARHTARILAQQPALTRVSRSVRNETLPIYYGVNIFVIHVVHDSIGEEGVAYAPGAVPVRLNLDPAMRWLDSMLSPAGFIVHGGSSGEGNHLAHKELHTSGRIRRRSFAVYRQSSPRLPPSSRGIPILRPCACLVR